MVWWKSKYIGVHDKNQGVTRGTVRSAAPLSDTHRNNLKGLVGKFIQGDVVLNYEEDGLYLARVNFSYNLKSSGVPNFPKGIFRIQYSMYPFPG